MAEPKLNYVQCPDANQGHRMAYWEWGAPEAAHVVVCVHGLTRQGRDFDVLAQALIARAAGPIRVVCPDVAGRGRSDFLTDPQGYQVPQYVGDMLALLAQLHATSIDWVGTSMGGLIGMGLLGQTVVPLPVAVRHLVLNDVGPVLQWQAIERIGTYVGRTLRFDSLQQAADALWAIASSFGPHTPAQWLELTRHMVKPLASGESGVTLHYDPAIAVPFRQITQEAAQQGEAALWQLYDQIQAPTLLLRGADSDLLSIDTAQQMAQRGPRARLVEFAGVGHAPTLIAPDQLEVVTSFLLG
ncbi:MAG: alpha/beta hydrolase [Burkholderiales bacterium]